MVKISAALKKQLMDEPEETFNLIIRTKKDTTRHLNWLTSEGIKVNRQFRLTPGLAVTCQGRDAVRLLTAKWVVSIELDQEITTM